MGINNSLSGATESIVLENETEVNNDFQYARENLYKVSELGNKALESMIDIAQSSEHPRAFEVLATLMKQMTDAQKDLLTLREKQNRITGKTQESPNSVTNALFVGSTAELQKMLKKNDNESNS
jgi:DNA-binding ferritin-like protein